MNSACRNVKSTVAYNSWSTLSVPKISGSQPGVREKYQVISLSAIKIFLKTIAISRVFLFSAWGMRLKRLGTTAQEGLKGFQSIPDFRQIFFFLSSKIQMIILI
jgi:hypothetical protein